MKMDIKKDFEQNMLDGDDLEDCGKAMLSAKDVFDYILQREKALIKKIKKLKFKYNDPFDEYHEIWNQAIDKVIDIIKEDDLEGSNPRVKVPVKEDAKQ